MDWRDKMRLGIELIHEACEQDMQGKNCHDCPFYICCDILRHAGIVTPDNWEE